MSLANTPAQPVVDTDGTLHVPAYQLPESSLLNHLSKTQVRSSKIAAAEELKTRPYPAIEEVEPAAIEGARQSIAEHYYTTEKYQAMTARYPVTIEHDVINGVAVEVFTPLAGISESRQPYVLINFHGGAFISGARTLSRMESMPIAALAGIKVISVDYRLGPEHQFPAASDDAISVYSALLKHYQPQNIGLYGSSAGAVLTAQTVSRIVTDKLPMPRAVGLFAAGAYYWNDGDSGPVRAAQIGVPPTSAGDNAYLKAADPSDPLVFPGNSDDVIAAFPPSLLISSSRDFGLSSVVKTHSQFTRLGVKAALNIWEGLEHCFFYDSTIPESQEAYNIIVAFFDQNLIGGD